VLVVLAMTVGALVALGGAIVIGSEWLARIIGRWWGFDRSDEYQST